MSKSALTGIVSAFLGIVLLCGCAGRRPPDQIAFGIWAAERDLWDEAVFRWKKVLVENPNSVATHNNLAVAFERKGLWEEARKEYEIALKLAPENTWIRSNYKKFQAHLEPASQDKKEPAEKNEKK